MNKKRIPIALAVIILPFVLVIIEQKLGVSFVGTAWALLPAFVAIALALITKEAYSSLFIGVLLGAFMVAECSVGNTLNVLTVNALSKAIGDNAGVFIFLVILGVIVALINKSGASRAFGRWASTNIKTKPGALFATFVFGVLIFIDDYFNCLTVGSVMSPITDSKKISRVKLAYIIDATAAPVCMIAPVSSWAAAVSSCVESEQYSGIELFIRSIPYNFYSILTFVFIIGIIFFGIDYGKMSGFEIKARETGDLSILDSDPDKDHSRREVEENGPEKKGRGKTHDLIIPIILLIVCCVGGLLYNGFENINWEGDFVYAFSETDSGIGLPWGSIIALVMIIVYLVARRIINFKDAMDCIPKGFMAMVPAITILVLAQALKNMTKEELAATAFVKDFMEGAGDLTWLLPAVIFVVACIIAFATGTSWATFGILIPIVSNVFPETSSLFYVGISACLAGAVCGDHCSPISDTTIMSSAGAQCNHIDHVETQLPYAITVACISFVSFLAAGLLDRIGLTWLSIPLGILLTVAFLLVMKSFRSGKEQVTADN